MIRWQWQNASSRQVAARGLLLLVVTTIFLISIFWNPEQTNILPCYFQQLTRHPCPSCGLSRSFHAIAHGQLRQAVQFHPLGVVIYLGLMAFLLKVVVELLWHKQMRIILNARAKSMAIVTLGWLWIGCWIYRLLVE